jgi:hypothetical protein
VTAEPNPSKRGHIWFEALTGGAGVIATGLRSVCVADAALGGAPARFIAVVPDARNRFPGGVRNCSASIWPAPQRRMPMRRRVSPATR